LTGFPGTRNKNRLLENTTMSTKRFIAIAGNIGSGKTTLTQKLADHFSWEPHFEVVVENPYLADFYGDMNRWSMQLQVFFLSKRFQAHQQITASKSSGIQDRSIYEDAHIFARALRESGKMDERDYQNYHELYTTMSQFLTPPDLVVYVRRGVQCLKERIRERGRDYEVDMPTPYLEHLNTCYDEWMENYRIGKRLVVEADNLDLKNNPEHFAYVVQSIENSLEQPELSFRC